MKSQTVRQKQKHGFDNNGNALAHTKDLLLRPFRHADKKQSKDDIRARKKRKGFVMCNLDTGRIFWNFDHEYDMSDQYSSPTPLPKEEAFPLMTPSQLLKYGK